MSPAGDPAPGSEEARRQRERRLKALIARLPPRLRPTIERLRRPGARWLRITAGILFCAGGLLWILPILGLWMLPLGLILLAEDVPPLARLMDRILDRVERRWPHWLQPPDKEG